MKLTLPNIIDRLAATQPATPLNLYHLNSNKFVFISNDTQSGNNIVELRSDRELDNNSDFIIQTDTINSGYKILSNSVSYSNQGLIISNDIETNSIVEINNNCKGFSLIKPTLTNKIVWLINDEKQLYLKVDLSSSSVVLINEISGNTSDYLFYYNENSNGKFSIQHIASQKYIGVDLNRKIATLVDTINYFDRSGVNPYLINDDSSGLFLYVAETDDPPIILAADNPIPANVPFHFTIKEPENLYQIVDPISQNYLFCSQNTQSNHSILMAKPISDFTNIIDSYFTIRIKSDVSILVTCATLSNPDINVYTDFANIQNWAVVNNFFIYGALFNSFVPIPNPNPWPQSLLFDSKTDFRNFIKFFISDSLTNNLIIYYTGHGSQDWVQVVPPPNVEKNVEHYLCILFDPTSWYSDQELTEDLNNSISFGKRVYLVFDCCYAGGDINPWQLKHRFQHDIIGYFAANSEITAPSDDNGSPYTNAFLKHFTQGIEHYKLDEKILDETFIQGQWSNSVPVPFSPTTEYSRPKLCVEKFCKL